VDSLCFGPICRGIDLTGEDSVCNLSDTLVYKVTRIGNCSNTLNWSLPSGVYSQNVNDTTVKINFPVARLYKIKATNNGACADQSDSITVMVKPAPSVINLGNDSLICNSTQKIVLDPGAGYNKYRWQDNSNSQQFTVTQSGFYYVTATNYCNQEKSDSVKLTIRNDAGFSVSPGDTSYCIQSPIQFTAKGGDVYSWSPVAFLNDPTTNNPIGNPDSSITYTVTITDTLCKITKDLDVKIVIVPLLQITLSKSNDVDCTTGAARLTATGGTTYQWSPTSTLSNPNIGSPTARPLETTTYNVIASNSLGCQTKDSITVHFSKTGIAELFVPNAFSPNNDRKNDVFRVLLKGAFKLKQFAVFNRYGEMIFSTSDSSKDWNGYYKNTLQLPGVYVWMVKAWSPCTGDFFKKGTILLVK
jgi:gliding motility-associated-like protein